MKILILGGTNFVGRLCAEEAVTKGHAVTVFNRGSRSNPDDVAALTGDRLEEGGYKALEGVSFDAVIDTWQNEARAVTSAVEALNGRIGQYIYVSTISVYNVYNGGAPGPTPEETELVDPEKTDDEYTKNKILGEFEALKSGVPTLLLRPGIVMGRYENTPTRIPWWFRRLERGGPTLAPGPPDSQLQFIDGRDLASFAIHGAEQKLEGAYNLNSDLNAIDYKGLLDTINEAAGGRAKLYWVEPAKVLEAGFPRFGEMPNQLLPRFMTGAAWASDLSKGRKAGLHTRPARETILDCCAWIISDKILRGTPSTGIAPDQESAILNHFFGDV